MITIDISELYIYVSTDLFMSWWWGEGGKVRNDEKKKKKLSPPKKKFLLIFNKKVDCELESRHTDDLNVLL